jgi:hypothetical protein
VEEAGEGEQERAEAGVAARDDCGGPGKARNTSGAIALARVEGTPLLRHLYEDGRWCPALSEAILVA